MSQREGLKTSWVYSLKKEELVAYLVQCGQDSCGTVEDMRKRLAKFITTNTEESTANKLLEWQKLHEQGHTSSPSVSLHVPDEKTEGRKPQIDGETPQSSNFTTRLTTATREDRIATIDLIRKWGLKYDGGKDVLKFVDRLEELSAIYEVSPSDVVPVMCELLRDRALTWFRNNKRPWTHWSQFKEDLLEFFLPQRYFEKLEVEIRARTQRPRENFKDFVLALQELMYHANLSEEEKLEVIFRNSLPDYQWFIRRRDFKTLTDLLSLAAELESIPAPKPPGRSDHNRILRDQQPPPIDPAEQIKCQSYLSWEEEKITATIVVNDQVCSAIIDTRATRSFVKSSLLKQMKQKPKYKPTNIEVTLADGSKKSISTAIQVPVTLGNMSKNHEFLIMKEATEAIVLGLDFLRAFKATICCAGLSVQGEMANDRHTSINGPQNKVSKQRCRNLSTNPYIISQAQEHRIQHRIQEFLSQELPRSQQIKGLSTAATHRIIRYAPRNPAKQAIIDEGDALLNSQPLAKATASVNKVRLSGAGRKRLKNLLERGYDIAEARKLAVKPKRATRLPVLTSENQKRALSKRWTTTTNPSKSVNDYKADHSFSMKRSRNGSRRPSPEQPKPIHRQTISSTNLCVIPTTNPTPTAPSTLGKGWIDTRSAGKSEGLSVQCRFNSSSPMADTASPTSSPPFARTPSPPPTPAKDLPDNPQLSELPVKIQTKIIHRVASFQKKRARFIQNIWGRPYRITCKRDGSINIVRR